MTYNFLSYQQEEFSAMLSQKKWVPKLFSLTLETLIDFIDNFGQFRMFDFALDFWFLDWNLFICSVGIVITSTLIKNLYSFIIIESL